MGLGLTGRRSVGLAICGIGLTVTAAGAIGYVAQSADPKGDAVASASTTTTRTAEVHRSATTQGLPAETTADIPEAIPETTADEADASARPIEACDSFAAQPPDSPLAPVALRHGTDHDPRLGRPRPFVGFDLSGALEVEDFASMAPYDLVIAVADPAAGSNRAGEGPSIDSIGTIQYWISWDGTASLKRRRVRTEHGWDDIVGDDAVDLTALLTERSLRFFTDDLTDGMRIAGLAATASGSGPLCAAIGLDATGMPSVPLTEIE